MVQTTTFAPGLTREALEALSHQRGEPAWLLQLRLEAHAAEAAMPQEPLRTGNWRHETLQGLDLEHQSAVVETSGSGSAQVSPAEAAAWIAQLDGQTVAGSLDPELATRGVRVEDLSRAASDATLGERVRAHLAQTVPMATDRYTALHYAFLNAGMVVYVPRGVVIEQLVILDHAVRAPGLALFPHVLLIVEEGAQVAVLDRYVSNARGGAPLVSGVVELVAGPNAQVRYVQLQEWSEDVWSFSTQRAQLGADSHLRTLNAALGARFSRNTLHVSLDGNGAQADILGVVPGRGRQQVDFQTLQDHYGTATRSDLKIHNALDDRSNANFTGLIRINASARQTESSQEQRNVLLSPKARADSDPKLEILNNDVVRCTHGATVGPLDAELLFYLSSRGLDLDEAQALLLEGFFRTVLDRLEHPRLAEQAWLAIAPKLPTGGA